MSPTEVTRPLRIPAAPAAGERPLVSVVVPTRGRPALLRETVASVVAQTYDGPIECIVVHDQEPADDSLADLARPDRQIIAVANTGAAGLAGARNCGTARSRGAFVASCDDDDVWHPTKLQKQMDLLLARPELVAVGSGLRLLFPGRSVEWPARAETIDRRVLLSNRVKELHSSTLVMRRETIDRVGRYDEELPKGNGEDYDWVLRLSAAGALGCVIEPLADIRKDARSWYQGDDRARTKAEALELFLSKHDEIRSSRRGHARILGQIAWAYSNAGERGIATRYVGRSLRRWYRAPFAYLALFHIVTRIPAERILKVTRRFGRGIT